MPSFSKTISIAAGLLSLASAAPFHAHSRFHSLKPRNGSGLGNAVVQNNCDYPIWLYSCGGDGGDGVQGQKIATGDSFTEAYRETIGVALKVTKEEGNLTAITHFEYAVIPDQNLLYYDISYVNCADGESASNCPGHEGGHKISSPSDSCPDFHCAPGTYCPTQAYYVPEPNLAPPEGLGIAQPVADCGEAGYTMDLHFTMCSG